ncbi:MAG: hypothetical protein ACTSO9_10315 [Candidatus Helarchaeota archaeon]
MQKEVLFEVTKHGNYFTKFPLKKAWGGTFGGFDSKTTLKHTSYNFDGKHKFNVKIFLTSEGIEFRLKNRNWKIYYNEIDECEEINVADYLNLRHSISKLPDFNVIYLKYSKNQEIYLLFWSRLHGWQVAMHHEFLRILIKQLNSSQKKEDLPIKSSSIIKTSTTVTTPEIKVKRGGQIQGSKFIFKLKVENHTPYNITNVSFQILSYPQESITLIGEKYREISKLDAGGFISPTFEFTPTKDCISGTIHSVISFIDHLNGPQIEKVRPYVISIVCGLLQPKEISIGAFTEICHNLIDYSKAGEEIPIPYNPKLIFEKLKFLLPKQNFQFVTPPDSKVIGDTFLGELNGFAEGKFNKKCVGLKIIITGNQQGNNCIGMIEGYAQDRAILPSLISELGQKMKYWNCEKCNGPLSKEDVEQLFQNRVIECRFCGNVISKMI